MSKKTTTIQPNRKPIRNYTRESTVQREEYVVKNPDENTVMSMLASVLPNIGGSGCNCGCGNSNHIHGGRCIHLTKEYMGNCGRCIPNVLVSALVCH